MPGRSLPLLVLLLVTAAVLGSLAAAEAGEATAGGDGERCVANEDGATLDERRGGGRCTSDRRPTGEPRAARLRAITGVGRRDDPGQIAKQLRAVSKKTGDTRIRRVEDEPADLLRARSDGRHQARAQARAGERRGLAQLSPQARERYEALPVADQATYWAWPPGARDWWASQPASIRTSMGTWSPDQVDAYRRSGRTPGQILDEANRRAAHDAAAARERARRAAERRLHGGPAAAQDPGPSLLEDTKTAASLGMLVVGPGKATKAFQAGKVVVGKAGKALAAPKSLIAKVLGGGSKAKKGAAAGGAAAAGAGAKGRLKSLLGKSGKALGKAGKAVAEKAAGVAALLAIIGFLFEPIRELLSTLFTHLLSLPTGALSNSDVAALHDAIQLAAIPILIVGGVYAALGVQLSGLLGGGQGEPGGRTRPEVLTLIGGLVLILVWPTLYPLAIDGINALSRYVLAVTSAVATDNDAGLVDDLNTKLKSALTAAGIFGVAAAVTGRSGVMLLALPLALLGLGLLVMKAIVAFVVILVFVAGPLGIALRAVPGLRRVVDSTFAAAVTVMLMPVLWGLIAGVTNVLLSASDLLGLGSGSLGTPLALLAGLVLMYKLPWAIAGFAAAAVGTPGRGAAAMRAAAGTGVVGGGALGSLGVRAGHQLEQRLQAGADALRRRTDDLVPPGSPEPPSSPFSQEEAPGGARPVVAQNLDPQLAAARANREAVQDALRPLARTSGERAAAMAAPLLRGTAATMDAVSRGRARSPEIALRSPGPRSTGGTFDPTGMSREDLAHAERLGDQQRARAEAALRDATGGLPEDARIATRRAQASELVRALPPTVATDLANLDRDGVTGAQLGNALTTASGRASAAGQHRTSIALAGLATMPDQARSAARDPATSAPDSNASVPVGPAATPDTPAPAGSPRLPVLSAEDLLARAGTGERSDA